MKSIDDILKERKKIVKRNIIYLNDKGEVVEKKNATKSIITEYDKDGNIINEIFGVLEKRKRRGGKIMEKVGKKFLPIGTVVMLKGGTKRVMITGFCAIEGRDRSKMWDYSGCMYPEGFLSSNQTCLFNHEQIEKVYHLGLAEDDEEKKFKKNLDELIKKSKDVVEKNKNKKE